MLSETGNKFQQKTIPIENKNEIKRDGENGQNISYEKLYYSLWELAGRYSSFCQFRVIGNSHDERMIPMLEIGTSQQAIFCVSGIEGTQKIMPLLLQKMAEEYCRAYECGWELEELYQVKNLLNKIRICIIPLLNPDGYEITRNGFGTIRNPIYRQMLRMQSIPAKDFGYNVRGVDISHNFPTFHYIHSRMGEEPASENETKALVRMIQEYESRGLLTFGQSGREIIYFHSQQGLGSLPKSYRLARHMQKSSSYHLEREQMTEPSKQKYKGMGTPEQYYIQTRKQPAFRIKVPAPTNRENIGEEERKRIFEEIHLLPLEYIFSLDQK